MLHCLWRESETVSTLSSAVYLIAGCLAEYNSFFSSSIELQHDAWLYYLGLLSYYPPCIVPIPSADFLDCPCKISHPPRS